MTTTLVGTPDPEPPRRTPTYVITSAQTITSGNSITGTWSSASPTRPAPVKPALPDPHDADDHVCHENCHGWEWES